MKRPHSASFAVASLLLTWVLFVGLVVGFTTWRISVLEQSFCTILVPLSQAPSPPPVKGVPSAPRVYDQRLSEDIKLLTRNFGC